MPELRPRTPTPVEASRRNGVRRLDAIRGQQTRIGREIRDRRERRRLRKTRWRARPNPEARPAERNGMNDSSPRTSEPGGQVGLDEFCTHGIHRPARANPSR